MLECFSYILVADFGDIIPNLYDLDILKFQVICSSGKSIESIVMSMLYEKAPGSLEVCLYFRLGRNGCAWQPSVIRLRVS